MSITRPRPKWNVEKTNPDLIEALDAAFREVLDPEVGLNVMELGLVRDVIVNDQQGHVRMMMTTPFAHMHLPFWKVPVRKRKMFSSVPPPLNFSWTHGILLTWKKVSEPIGAFSKQIWRVIPAFFIPPLQNESFVICLRPSHALSWLSFRL
jgi:hypothetical protein